MKGFRDSSAQHHFGPGLLGPNRFFTGTPRPGTPRPSIKILYLWHTRKANIYLEYFYFNIRFSSIGKRNVKRKACFHTNKACVQGSTNGTNGMPILFKVLPIVPLVIPLVPMVMSMVPLALPMVPLVPLVS